MSVAGINNINETIHFFFLAIAAKVAEHCRCGQFTCKVEPNISGSRCHFNDFEFSQSTRDQICYGVPRSGVPEMSSDVIAHLLQETFSSFEIFYRGVPMCHGLVIKTTSYQVKVRT